ncbi:MAG: M23 family metallopeptidase [Verrucomicrobiota bacterium]
MTFPSTPLPRWFGALLLAVLVGRLAPAQAQVNALTTLFAQIRTTTQWPVDGTGFDQMTSTFGPRLRLSTGAYDWHRGIDIDAPEGASVRAVLDGTFFGIRTYADGGLTVILQHTFPQPVVFQGRTLSQYYTFYMHLSSVDPVWQAAEAAGTRPFVARGALIGGVGHTGSAVDDHLHLELRVGAPYSLEWQLQNPTSVYGANAFGFDPHVHPLWLYPPYPVSDMALTLRAKPGKTDGVVRFSCNDDQPLLNRVEVRIRRKSDNRLMASHVLDLNERTGFNASSTAALDTVDASKPYFSPQPFGAVSPYLTDVVIPRVFVGSLYGTKYTTQVVVYDLWGTSRTLSW